MELVNNTWHRPAPLRSEINRIVGDRILAQGSPSMSANWVPSADVSEYADRYELFIDLPGVNPDSVDISVEKGVLSVSGERHYPGESKNEQRQSHHAERGQGRFHRRFILPDMVDIESIEARSNLGVLQIAIGKLPAAQPRRISVSVA